MAKTLTPSELAAQLQSLGLKVPAELKHKIENEFEDNAVEKVANAMVEDNAIAAAEWQTELFNLADRIVATFKTERVNKQGKGSGQVDRTQLVIETHVGTLLLKVSSDV